MFLKNLGNRIVNNWIYKTDDGLVLIDTGYEDGYSQLKRQLSRHNLTIQDIRYIFLTHAHDDHAGYLNELLRETAAIKVIMSDKALAVLFRGQNSFEGGCTSLPALFFCNLMKAVGKGRHRFPSLNPDFTDRCILIEKENRSEVERILCGKIIDTPGHTEDSISLLLNDGSLFCGDAAMNGLPSLNKITIWVGDREAYLQSWKTIISTCPKIIYPGHGTPFSSTKLINNLENVQKMSLYPLTSTK